MIESKKTTGRYLFDEFFISIMGYGILKDFHDFKKWTIVQKFSFLHEYIHFFQNIYTYYGLNIFFLLIDNSWSFRRFIGKEIVVPFRQSPSEHCEELVTWIFTQGDTTGVKKVISYRIENVKNGLGVVWVRCFNYDDEEVEIKFGSRHIDEGMACLIQESIYPEIKGGAPFNPYYIASELADMIIPGISENKYIMVALFDHALHFNNPAYYFVKYLEKKRKEGFSRTSLTCDRVYDEIGYLPTNHILTVNEFLKEVDDIFEYSDSADRTREWFNTIIKRSMNIRMNRPRIFIELMQGGDISNNDTFMYLLDELGTPIVTNENKDYCFLPPRNTSITETDLISFYAMLQINKVFYSKGRYSCPLIDYCKKKLSAYVDERCETYPWLQPQRFRKCFFSDCWERFGLKGVRIIGEESKQQADAGHRPHP